MCVCVCVWCQTTKEPSSTILEILRALSGTLFQEQKAVGLCGVIRRSLTYTRILSVVLPLTLSNEQISYGFSTNLIIFKVHASSSYRTTALWMQPYRAFFKYTVYSKKALYGCIQSAVLRYEELASTLKRIGFVENPYDICSSDRARGNTTDRILVYITTLKLIFQRLTLCRSFCSASLNSIRFYRSPLFCHAHLFPLRAYQSISAQSRHQLHFVFAPRILTYLRAFLRSQCREVVKRRRGIGLASG